MPFDPQGYIKDPRNADPLHLFGQIMEDANLGGGVVDMLMGGVQSQRQSYAEQQREATRQPIYADPASFDRAEADRERARYKARMQAQSAQQQQMVEQKSDESYLQQLIRPVNPFEEVSQEALQPR